METVGMYRVKNEERWIGESLKKSLTVADRIVLFDDHSTDRTVEIASSFDRVTVIRSPFSGLNESRDKNFLWDKVLELAPRYVFLLDGDEVFNNTAVEEIKTIVASGAAGNWQWRIVYLWDSPNQERIDPPYGTFFKRRFWSLHNYPNPKVLRYPTCGEGPNFHCGAYPRELLGPVISLRGLILHYGYMLEADRQRKYKFYTTNDPGNLREGEYLHIIGKPDCVAPGPVKLVPFHDT